MNKRLLAESENGQKRVFYLIVSHGIWVDEISHIFDFFKSQTDVLSPLPETAFLALTNSQREKILNYVYDSVYLYPEFCSISGFKLVENGMVATFSRYEEHIKELLDDEESGAQESDQEMLMDVHPQPLNLQDAAEDVEMMNL